MAARVIDVPFEDIEDAVLSYAAIVSSEFDDDRQDTAPHLTDEDVSAVVRRIGKDVTRPYPSATFENIVWEIGGDA